MSKQSFKIFSYILLVSSITLTIYTYYSYSNAPYKTEIQQSNCVGVCPAVMPPEITVRDYSDVTPLAYITISSWLLTIGTFIASRLKK